MRKSRISRREFLLVSTIAAGGGVLAACSSPATPTTEAEAPEEPASEPAEEQPAEAPPAGDVYTVGFWNGDGVDFQQGYQAIVDAFNAANTDVKMEVKNVPGGFDEKLLAMLAANEGPDFWMKIDAVSNARHGHFEPVDSYLQADGIKLEETFFDIAWKTKLWEGKLYGMPRDVGWAAWGYNKDLFDEMGVPYPKEGWTIEEFVDTAVKLTDKEKGYWGSHVAGSGALLWGTQALPFNMNFDINSEDGRQVVGILDSPESIEAIQFIIDMETVHEAAPGADALEALGGTTLASGKVAIGDTGTWGLDMQDAFPFNWEMLSPPVKPGVEAHSWGGSVHYYMWSGGKHKPETWKAMRFAAMEGSKIAQETGQWLSAMPSVWEELKANEHPVLAWVMKDAEKPTHVPPYEREKFWEAVGTPYFDIWTRYIENEERPLADIVKDAAQQAQSALDEAFKAEEG
jgi:multiple sugar transport system substrate-binding protein